MKVHKGPSVIPILFHINIAFIITSYFFKTHANIVLLSKTAGSFQALLLQFCTVPILCNILIRQWWGMKKGGTKKSTALANFELRAHDISLNFNKHFGDVSKLH